MMKATYIIISLLSCLSFTCTAQTETVHYAENTIHENRRKEYSSLVNNSIIKNLSYPLTGLTEENWEDAFAAMELINYRSAKVDAKIRSVFIDLEKRSTGFQRAFLELVYANYPKDFVPQVTDFINQTKNVKLFAMGAEYILMNKKDKATSNALKKHLNKLRSFPANKTTDPIITILEKKLTNVKIKMPPLSDLTGSGFLKNETVLYSFQRKNRNYPGLAMVRGKDGKFIQDETGKYFHVPQLARSLSNMAGYLTNGNTAQGIFKVFAFDVSKSSMIGPTTNIQMVMPFEKSADVDDSVTQKFGNNYKNLLPVSWQNYYPVFEAYYAGMAGRTEIIAHGTTVNPAYYKDQSYYPLTPTLGCLTTKEIWSTVDGSRLESDQQKLVNAIKAAGGADGYCLVIEIDDEQKPVSLQDILPYLNQIIK